MALHKVPYSVRRGSPSSAGIRGEKKTRGEDFGSMCTLDGHPICYYLAKAIGRPCVGRRGEEGREKGEARWNLTAQHVG